VTLNIYVLDIDPAQAARDLSDHHVRGACEVATSVIRTAHAMRVGGSLKGLVGPRHPLTRYAARSCDFVSWLDAYAKAANHEAWWRGLRSAAAAAAELQMLLNSFCNVADPVDVVHPSTPVTSDAGVTGAPQRLDGRPDLQIPGDPVTAYRRWYAATKLGGGPGVWDRQVSSWTRRPVPGWLAEHAPIGYAVRVETLAPSGLGFGEPPHDVHVASLVPLDSTPGMS